MKPPLVPEHLLRTAEVARLWKTNPKTVTRWIDAGLLHPIRTPGGRNRFRLTEVLALFADCGGDEALALAILGGGG